MRSLIIGWDILLSSISANVSFRLYQKAKEIFCEHKGYEGNVALCHNFIGLCCIDFKQFELAEESFNTAIHLLQQHDKEENIF